MTIKKKEYCTSSLDMAEDKTKVLERSLQADETAIASAKEGLETLTEEIAGLKKSIVALDKSVREATEQRKNENAEFKDLLASNNAAKSLIFTAKNRLLKFYAPKLYKPPTKEERSTEDRIMMEMGGTASFAQVSTHRHRKEAPAPPPETWDAYAKKSEQGTGVIAMLDLLVKTLDTEITEAQTEEKDAQMDYEALMQDSAGKRAVDSKSLSDKVTAKAEMEGKLQAHEEAKAASTKELMATHEFLSSLHGECDWLLQYYGVRKDAREGEVDALKKAKAILSGASFESLAQVAVRKGFLGASK